MPAGARARHCLLKGCEQPFHPRQANQRYCSSACRKAARRWSRWKAQQRYRATPSGKAKRTDQSRRYRERIKTRKPPEPEADNEAARVPGTKTLDLAVETTLCQCPVAPEDAQR